MDDSKSIRTMRNRAIREALGIGAPRTRAELLLPELCTLVVGYDTRPGQRFRKPSHDAVTVSEDGRTLCEVANKKSLLFCAIRGMWTFAEGACRWRLHIGAQQIKNGVWVGIVDGQCAAVTIGFQPLHSQHDFPSSSVMSLYLGETGSGFWGASRGRPDTLVIPGRKPTDCVIEMFADVAASRVNIASTGWFAVSLSAGSDLSGFAPYFCIQCNRGHESNPILIESEDE